MTIVFNPFSIPVIITALFSAILAIIIKKRKNTHNAGYLIGLLILVVLWCVSYTFELCFVGEREKLIAIMFEYIAIPNISVLFALFVYRYINPSQRKRRFRTGLLFLPSAAFTLLMATNAWHGLSYTGWAITSIPGQAYTFLIPEYGIAVTLQIIFSYALIFSVFAYLIYVSIKTTKLFSAQAIVLFCCAALPIISNIMYMFSTPLQVFLDITPIAFFFSSAFMAYLITGMKLLDLQPLARDMIVEKTTDGTILLDSDFNVLDLNPMAEKIFGVRKTDVLGKNSSVLLRALPPISKDPKETYQTEFVYRYRTYSLSAMALHQKTDTYVGQILVIRDITQTKLAEQRIERLAYIDPLTNLPNQSNMMQALKKKIEDAQQQKSALVVMLVDINNAGHINSSYGYSMGDALIKKVADMIHLYVSKTDIFARMKGSDFLIATPVSGTTVQSLAKNICNIFMRPIRIDDKYIFISVSMGICIYPTDGKDASTLVQNASLALQHAKTNKNQFAFYSAKKGSEIAVRNKMLNALHTAIEKDEFSLAYQPQYNYETKSLYGVEVLLRWTHPEFGQVPPSRFISLLEDSGIIISVGNWVITESAKQFREWMDKGVDVPKYSINLSVRQFDNEELVPFILETLNIESIPTHCLEVEVTETLAALADNRVVDKIRALSNAGVRIAVDDFGDGFSSLTYFKYLHIDTLKIDRVISIDIHENNYSATIFKSLKLVCDELNVDILTEFIETPEQIEKLISLGCKNFQGYYYSKPLCAAAFEEYAASLKA